MARVLFVTWDGPQVSYLESLFLPIFGHLKHRGLDFSVIQFTWGLTTQKAETIQGSCQELGIPYKAIQVWRRPLTIGAYLSALSGAKYISKYVNDNHIDLVLARSTLPAFATLQAIKRTNVKFVFDADGLPQDERVDFGGWSSTSLKYRMLRDLEADAVRRADAVLTRTFSAVDILVSRSETGTLKNKFTVVANGRDENIFTPLSEMSRQDLRKSIGIGKDDLLIIYVGSLGRQYCVSEMLYLFQKILQINRNSYLLILTGSPEAAEKYLEKLRIEKHHCIIKSVHPYEVPKYIGASDVGLALREPSFSMQAVAPIKIGEYLLCGIPVVATTGVGDTDKFLSSDVGLILKSNSKENLEEAALWILNNICESRREFRKNCRQVGLRCFGISAAVDVYEKALKKALYSQN